MLPAFIRRLQQQARAADQRRCLVISGDQSWVRSQLAMASDDNQWWWIGDQPLRAVANVVPMNRAGELLGRELQVAVFNCFSGFHPDAFGAVSGAVCGGGLLILLAPSLAQWPDYADPDYLRYVADVDALPLAGNHFLRRLVALLKQDDSVSLIEQHRPWPVLPSLAPLNEQHHKGGDDPDCASSDQQLAVAEVIKTVTGHRRRPLVLSADRGRGKSSALGIAAARLLQQQLSAIVVTAPSPAAANAIFDHAHRLLAATPGEVKRMANRLDWEGKTLRFIAPDELVQQPACGELLLVDEAAAIPVPLLTDMLHRYSRLVYATTLHGYEGTGRGFSLRFQKVLSKRTPNWRQLHLSQPIRWQVGDPVEALVFKALALDAQAATLASHEQVQATDCQIAILSQAELASQPVLLEQLFGLLILAHYRTTPSDFRQLLDAPQLRIFVMLHQGRVVATALLSLEGELESSLAAQIWAGRRRLRGHLLPQSLTAQVGMIAAAGLKYGRIMRIAVHPQCHRQGLGRALHHFIEQWSLTHRLDFIGASFGATLPLLNYWQAVHCRLVRLGIGRDAASGSHGALVLAPLSEAARELMPGLLQRFYRQLPVLLTHELANLEPELVLALIATRDRQLSLPLDDELDIAAFAWGGRPLELVLPALQQLVWSDGERLATLEPAHHALLVKKIIQRQAWPVVVQALGLSGRKAAERLLREAIGELVPGLKNRFEALLRRKSADAQG